MTKMSGLDGHKGEAVETLWAEILSGTLTPRKRNALLSRYNQTAGGVPFSDVEKWLDDLASRLRRHIKVVSAVRTPLSVNGDVEAKLRGGGTAKFEVKAQVKKESFDDIIQSDWVRDQTDFLSKLVRTDPSVKRHFKQVGASALGRISVDYAWPIEALHAVDVAGLTNAEARRKEGVGTPADLPDFIRRKWFLHVTASGARLCRYTEMAPIKNWLSNGDLSCALKANRKGQALVCLAPSDDDTWFTYHLYPSEGIKGRHKLHESALRGVAWI